MQNVDEVFAWFYVLRTFKFNEQLSISSAVMEFGNTSENVQSNKNRKILGLYYINFKVYKCVVDLLFKKLIHETLKCTITRAEWFLSSSLLDTRLAPPALCT